MEGAGFSLPNLISQGEGWGRAEQPLVPLGSSLPSEKENQGPGVRQGLLVQSIPGVLEEEQVGAGQPASEPGG